MRRFCFAGRLASDWWSIGFVFEESTDAVSTGRASSTAGATCAAVDLGRDAGLEAASKSPFTSKAGTHALLSRRTRSSGLI